MIRPHSVYYITCVCGKENKTLTAEFVCTSCHRHGQIDWRIEDKAIAQKTVEAKAKKAAA